MISERRMRDRRLRIVGSIVVGVFLLGVAGYMIIEGWGVVDALYMTVITLGTVGFGEVEPLSPVGRVFTSILIVLGVGTVAYSFSLILDFVINAELSGEWRRRRMRSQLDSLEKHVIVCGYGRVGRRSAQSLVANKRTVVVVDNAEERVAQAADDGLIGVLGDATNDETLRDAGVERADGLLVCTGDDAKNLFVVLSARGMNPRLSIVARATDSANESKMLRAGANKVISPYIIGGMRMANAFLRPHVAEFLEGLTLDSGQALWIEELVISPLSPMVGKTLGEIDLRQKIGVTLLGILRRDGLVQPDKNTRFMRDDRLIVVGSEKQLADLDALERQRGV